jgi:predicted ATPase
VEHGTQVPDPDRLGEADFPVRFGRYALLGILGDGGTARVFRAELQGPAGFRKPCALKVVRADARHPAATETHVFDEARIGGRLLHPNLVETYDVGERDGRLFVAMQLIDGLTARNLARLNGALPSRALFDLARQLADGLAHAHSLKVDGRPADLVHRDLKPANVLIGREGIARIADFGIARAVGLSSGDAPTGAVWGTLGYMAPEQAYGKTAMQASDVFSLGIVLAEMATGKRFAPVKDMAEYAAALHALPPELDGLGRHVDRIVPGFGPVLLKCLRANPLERWPNGSVLAAALRAITPPPGLGLADVVQSALGESAAVASTGEGVDDDARDPWADADGRPVTAQHTLATLAAELPESSHPVEVVSDLFVGRVETLHRLSRALLDEVRVLVLCGLGGIGKTRLARELVVRVASRLPGGASVCDLTEARTLDGALQCVARVLGLPVDAGGEPGVLTRQIGASLAARGPMLLVLDAFDGVASHANATVGRWREAAPEARIVLTSRERVRLGAGTRGLPGLTPTARGEGQGPEDALWTERLEPLTTDEGFDLLVARMRAVHSDFSPTEPEVEALERLAEALDGVPLALELAAAQARPGDPRALEPLAQQATNAGVESVATPDPLRAALEWSWDRLDAWERDALAQLSVFRGGFTVEACAEVLDLSAHPDAPWPMFVLERLLERSLLRVLLESSSDGPDAGSEARFGMFAPVRAFAAEHLGAARGETERRLATHFARFGTPEILLTFERHGGLARLRALGRDRENLELATELALGHLDPEVAAGAALALATASELGGSVLTALRLVQRVLAMDTPRLQRAWLCLRLSAMWRQIARAEESASIAQEVARMAASLAEPGLEARALELWAAASMDGVEARADLARDACARGIDRAQAGGDTCATGMLLARLGAVELRDANLELAREYLGQALTVHRDVGHRWAEAHTRAALGETCLQLGLVDEGAKHLRGAVRIARELEDRAGEAYATLHLARLALVVDQPGQAIRLGDRARVLFHGLGNRRAEARVLGVLGEAHLALDELADARAHLEAAVTLSDDLGDGTGMGAFRAVLAGVSAAERDVPTARYLLRAAESFLREARDPAALARAVCRRGHVELVAGNLVGAWAAHEEATRVARGLGTAEASPLGRALQTLEAALTEG